MPSQFRELLSELLQFDDADLDFGIYRIMNYKRDAIRQFIDARMLAAGIYNRLFQFFRRYYQDGDFISQRRYSSSQRYAIPYNGAEVYLH